MPRIFIGTHASPFSFAGGCVKGFIFDENTPRKLTFQPADLELTKDSADIIVYES